MSSGQPGPAAPAAARPLWEDGLLTGLVGAGLVAAWFLLLDCIRGAPFFTPSLLGSVVFDHNTTPGPVVISTKNVFAYSGLHVILFLVVGWGLAWMFREFELHPQFGLIYLLLYGLFEAIIFALELSMVPGVLGLLGTWAVAVGNVLSAVGMFVFLLRRHPRAIQRLVEGWHDRPHADLTG